MNRKLLHLVVLCALMGLAACQTQRVLVSKPVTLVEAPEPLTQEWPAASPADQGMDDALLVRLRQKLTNDAPAIRSVLVVRRGYLIFEYYGQGVGPGDLHRLNSVTKSFTSALVGAALERGRIRDVGQPLSDYFPETHDPAVHPSVRRLTIANLLTMTAGLDWDEEARDACLGSIAGPCNKFRIANDLVNYAIRRSPSHAPGAVFSYDSYTSHLLSTLVARATGTTTAKFAEANLFGALGVQAYRWDTDGSGNNLGGSGLYMRSRDLAKFGQLYLDKGAWRGKQLIPSDYVAASTHQHTAGGWPGHTGYGYQWWVPTAPEHLRMFFALGYGGQFVMVYPALALVVVITSNQAIASESRWITREFILPAVAATSD